MIEVLRLLHEQAESLTTYHGSYYIRHLYPDEPLPLTESGLIDTPLLQRDWLWVAYSKLNDKPLALLAACPCHGIAMLVRIYASKSSPKTILMGLLRKSLADISNRGYTRYVTYLDLDRDMELGLFNVASKAGATKMGGDHVMVTGPTNIKGW